MSTKQYYIMKWIALITMLIDHTAVAFGEIFNWDADFYTFCRTIGRLAFPLFCFMLVESFYFTNDKLRHFMKITILAILSEVPFDLALRGKVIDTYSQNVCVTLALGFIMLWVMQYWTPRVYDYTKSDPVTKLFAVPVFNVLMLFIFGVTATILGSDYGFSGIFLIWGFNLAVSAKNAYLRYAAVIIVFMLMRMDVMYIACLVDLVVIYALMHENSLDKTKFAEFVTSKKSKVIGSVFYPVHLAVIAVIRTIATIL